MKITEALYAEHLVFHHIFDHIERAAPALKTLPEIKAIAALLESVLKSHSDTEDELFLGPLEHCFEQLGQRDGFLREHQEMDESLHLVQKARQVGHARHLLLLAIANSRQHFHKEERIVFPLGEQVLNDKTLTDLSRSWKAQHLATQELKQARPAARRATAH